MGNFKLLLGIGLFCIIYSAQLSLAKTEPKSRNPLNPSLLFPQLKSDNSLDSTAFVPESLHFSNRVKRANGDQFVNGHVMSQKTFNELRRSKPGEMGKNFETFLQNVNKRDSRYPSVPNPYDQRKIHTMIVGNRGDVVKSIANGRSLPRQGRVNNLRESNRDFQQLEVRRDNQGQISKILDKGKRKFGAGVVNKEPVHYQANYNRGLSGGNNNRNTGSAIYTASKPRGSSASSSRRGRG